MQGASSFAILVLFIALPWASRADIVQPCKLVENGLQDGSNVTEDQGQIPMSDGAKLRIYIPDLDGNLNVVGSSLLFCDDQLEEVDIELAEDKESYLVTRKTDSEEDSFYWIKLVTEDVPPPPPPPPRRLNKRGKRPTKNRYY